MILSLMVTRCKKNWPNGISIKRGELIKVGEETRNVFTKNCCNNHQRPNFQIAASYKGLDLSFGQADGAIGGILIRSIEDINTGAYYEGPCICVNTILTLNKFGTNDVKGIVADDDFSLDVGKGTRLTLKYSEKLSQRTVVSSPRVGLTLKVPDDEKPYYIMKDYRFLSNLSQVKKMRESLICALNTKKDKTSLSNFKEVKVTKCVKFQQQGNKSSKTVESFCNQAISNDEICTLHGVWVKQFGS